MTVSGSAPLDPARVDTGDRSHARVTRRGSDETPFARRERTIGEKVPLWPHPAPSAERDLDEEIRDADTHATDAAVFSEADDRATDLARRRTKLVKSETLNPSLDDPEDESEETKRKRRMVSNRESARRSRERKLARVAELQDRCAALWSDRAQTVQNIQLMESLVHRVRHENLRLDVDAGRLARRIVAMRADAERMPSRFEQTPSLRRRGAPPAETAPRLADPSDATRDDAAARARDGSDAPRPPRLAEADEQLLEVFASAAA